VVRVAAAVGQLDRRAPIIPVVVGAEADAVGASELLLAGGVWVPAIRPPTVAPWTTRLRITVSAVHTDEQVDRLIAGLVEAGLAGPGARGPRGAGAP
jgi:8-amino-7-oxononanoate synthase